MITFRKFNLNRPYYFFNDIKNVDLNLLSIDKVYTKDTHVVIYSIKYIMMEIINSEIPLCLRFSDVDAYIIEENGNKYLIFALTKKNKKVLDVSKKLWSETKKQIKAMNSGESIKYKKDLMMIYLQTKYYTSLF